MQIELIADSDTILYPDLAISNIDSLTDLKFVLSTLDANNDAHVQQQFIRDYQHSITIIAQHLADSRGISNNTQTWFHGYHDYHDRGELPLNIDYLRYWIGGGGCYVRIHLFVGVNGKHHDYVCNEFKDWIQMS